MKTSLVLIPGGGLNLVLGQWKQVLGDKVTQTTASFVNRQLSKSMTVTQRLVVRTQIQCSVDRSPVRRASEECFVRWSPNSCKSPAGTYCIIWPPKVTSANGDIIHNDLKFLSSWSRSTRINVNLEVLLDKFLGSKRNEDFGLSKQRGTNLRCFSRTSSLTTLAPVVNHFSVKILLWNWSILSLTVKNNTHIIVFK